jgi:glycine cleavage system H protein
MAKLHHPDDLRYSKSDEWVRVEGGWPAKKGTRWWEALYGKEITIGITDYAQDQLGDIVYVELPWDGNETVTGDTKFGDIESVKATSELISPLTGTIIRVNTALKDKPELINDAPYTDGWMIVIKVIDYEGSSQFDPRPREIDALMNVQEYEQYLQGR